MEGTSSAVKLKFVVQRQGLPRDVGSVLPAHAIQPVNSRRDDLERLRIEEGRGQGIVPLNGAVSALV